jgi:hypothetical protein
MLDIKKLQNLRTAINLKEICRSTELNYITIYMKLYRNARNSNNGQLNPKEVELLNKGLKNHNLLFLD